MDEEAPPPNSPSVPIDLIGEGLLLLAVATAPWFYGAVEDSMRYALCSVLPIAALLFVWPVLRAHRTPNGLPFLAGLLALSAVQILLRQSVAPLMTAEAALVAFSMAVVWVVLDARLGSSSTDSARRLAWALLAVCAAESAFAAFQWSTDRRALFGAKNELQTAPFGSYVNHNNFAGLVSLGVPLAIAIAIGEVRRSGRLTPRGLGLVGLAAGLAIAVLASGSRGGAVALACGLVVLAWMSGGLFKKRSTHRSWLAPLAVGLAILALAVAVVPESTRSRMRELFERSGTVAYRIDMGMAAFHAFARRPLIGSGLGAFADAATPFKTGFGDVRSERAEADLIEFVVEGGLVLVAGLAFLGRFVWRSAKTEMTQGRGKSGRWLRAGALASCATMLIHSLFDFGFRIPANALAFAVLLGIASAGSEGTSPASAMRRRGFVAVLLIASVVCAYRSLGAVGERAALARATPESRLDALQTLVDTHPYLDQARRQRGLAWLALAYSHGAYDASRLERARRDLQLVVDHRPQWGEARADLGWLKYYAGQTAEARAELLQASRLDPTHMGVGLAYAQVLAWSGDTTTAVSEVSRLRRINPAWSRTSARDLASTWTRNPALLAAIP